jgi:hypothetical protein
MEEKPEHPRAFLAFSKQLRWFSTGWGAGFTHYFKFILLDSCYLSLRDIQELLKPLNLNRILGFLSSLVTLKPRYSDSDPTINRL